MLPHTSHELNNSGLLRAVCLLEQTIIPVVYTTLELIEYGLKEILEDASLSIKNDITPNSKYLHLYDLMVEVIYCVI